jgi:hypothetical protein
MLDASLVKVRSDWFGLAPKGASLSMREWVLIGRRVKRRRIKRHDLEKVRGVIDEYLCDRQESKTVR